MWIRPFAIAALAICVAYPPPVGAHEQPGAGQPANGATDAADGATRAESAADDASDDFTGAEAEGSGAAAEAAGDEADSAGPAKPGAQPWRPPLPSPTSFDWIRLKSGEWLKGEIKYLREDTMLFDSDELDELEFDWVDVRELRSPRLHTYILEGRRVVTGTAVLADGILVIGTEDGDREFKSGKLVSIVAGDASERGWWSGKLTIGLIAQTGNTKQTDFNTQLTVKRDAPVTRFDFLYTGVTSTQDDERTASNNRANVSLDIYVSRRFFVTAPFVAFYRDEFQNINYQITPGAGVGYDLFKTRWVEWEIGTGAAFQYTDFISTSTLGTTTSDLALLASTEINFDFTKDIEFDNSYQLQFVATNPGLTTQHLVSSLSFDIWGPLELDVSLNWDRVEDPVPDADGIQPESDDVRLSLGIAVDF